MPETRSLHRKLAQVMYEAERIPKRGKAPAIMGGYPFVQVGDAADFIRKALAEKVVTMMPTNVQITGQVDRQTAKGGNMTTVDLIVTWTLTDGESGESIEIQSFGAGADGGDKYSGKASTSAMKYALLSGFLLSTGDDTELGGDEPQHPRPALAPEVRDSEALGSARRLGKAEGPGSSPGAVRSDGSLIGIAKIGAKNTSDGELRVTPEGHHLGFRLEPREGDKGGILVEVNDPMASAMSALREDWVNQPVTCWGAIEDRGFTSPGKRTVTYQALVLSRISTPTMTLPAANDDEAELDRALALVP